MNKADGSVVISAALDTKGINAQLSVMGNLVKTALAAISLDALAKQVYAIGSSVIKLGSDFEAALSGIKAVSGATSQEMETLRQAAVEAGESTVYSASEAATAIEELIKAGLDSEQVLGGGLAGALDLAAAGEIGLADAAEIAATVLNAFKDDALDVGDAANVLAGAANASASDVMGLKLGLSQVSAVASGVGFSFNDTATALAVFAQNGLKGSDSGTSLKTMLMNLQPTTDKQIAQFEELGLITEDGANAFYDMNGEIKPLNEIAGLLNTSMAHLTDQERLFAMEVMFGSDAIRAANVLYKEGADGIDNMWNAMSKIEAADVAATRLDNLKGDIEELSGSTETFGINIYKNFDTPLREAVQSATKSVRDLSKAFQTPEMQRNLDKIGDGMKEIVKSIAEFAEKAIPIAVDAIAFFIGNGKELIEILLSIVAGFLAFKVAVVIANMISALAVGFNLLEAAMLAIPALMNAVTAAQTALSAATLASPLGPWALLIGGVVAGLGLLVTVMSDTNSEMDAFKEKNEEIIAANQDMAESLKNTREGYQDNTKQMQTETGVAKDLSKEIHALAEDIKRSGDSSEDAAGKKAKMISLIDQLNSVVPDLNLAWDEQAGALNKTNEETDAYIKNWARLVETEAATEYAIELRKKLLEAEGPLLESSNNLEAAKLRQAEADREAAAAAEHYTGMVGGTTALAAYGAVSSEVAKLTEEHQLLADEYKASEDALAAVTDKLTGYAEEAAAAAAATEEGFVSAQEVLQSFSSVGQENIHAYLAAMQESLGLSDEAVNEHLETLANYEEQATDIWGRIVENEALSLQQMEENAKYNTDAFEQWSADLDTLAKAGIDEGLIATLKAAGPEARASIAGLVAELEEGGVEAFAGLEDAFAAGGQAAVNAFMRDIGEGDLARPLTDEIGAAASAIESDTQMEDAMAAKGPATKESLNASIQEANFAESGDTAMLDAATGVTDSTHVETALTEKTAKTKEHSMTEVENNTFSEVGDKLQEDEATGVKDSTAVDEAVTEQIESAKTEADRAVTANDFESVGENISEGIAQGIRNGMNSISSAVHYIISQALAEAEAAADVNSPSKLFMPLGVSIDEGVGVGMEKSDYSSDAARDIVTRAYKAIDTGPMQMTHLFAGAAPASARGSLNIEQITVEGAPINHQLDAKKVGRWMGEEAADKIRLGGGFALG